MRALCGVITALVSDEGRSEHAGYSLPLLMPLQEVRAEEHFTAVGVVAQ
jgi:hypothetical protein